MGAVVAVLLVVSRVQDPGASAPAADPAAREALSKLASRLKDARSLSAQVLQSRRTELLDAPIVSSGTMYYRRDPACLVFHLTEPRKAEIRLDRDSYQVYRPDERRLERIDFGKDDVAASLLMVFEPKIESLSKGFTISSAPAAEGQIEVRLESSDEKVRRRLRRVVLTLSQADGSLRRLAYIDGEGDEVRLDLTRVEINPQLPPELFTLKIPEGVRVLRRSLGRDN